MTIIIHTIIMYIQHHLLNHKPHLSIKKSQQEKNKHLVALAEVDEVHDLTDARVRTPKAFEYARLSINSPFS